MHNTINEHIRLLRHDPNKNIDSVDEKLYKIIMFYNNSIHSTTGHKPVDFINGKIKVEEYPNIRQKIINAKEKYTNKSNENREDCGLRTGQVYIKQERGGKNHAKFRKMNVIRLDDDHVVTDKGYKYYKSHVKRQRRSV